MSADIVNLRRARKAKTRDDRSAAAGANRAKHGRTRSERETQVLSMERLSRNLDNHRIGEHLSPLPVDE